MERGSVSDGWRTCLVLQGISGDDTVGFCRQVPVHIDTIQMSLLYPEGCWSRWYYRQKHSRRGQTLFLEINLNLFLD